MKKCTFIALKYQLIGIFALLPLYSVLGQFVTINGSISDQNGQFLAAANVYFSNEYGGYSNQQGNFQFDIPKSLLQEGATFEIIGAYLGYKNDTIRNVYNGETSFTFTFSLAGTSYVLEPIVISDAPQIQFKNEAEFVLDFEFFQDGLAILTKEKRQYQVRFQNDVGNIISTIDIPFQSNKIVKSCLGDLHVLGELEGIQIHYSGFKWLIIDRYPAEKFEQNILPCLYHTQIGNFVFRQFRDFNQTIYYELFDAKGNIKWSHEVFNEEQQEYAVREFNKTLVAYHMSANAPDENRIDFGFTVDNALKEGTWNGDLMDLVVDNNTQFAVSYFKNIVIKPTYAPLFVQQGEIVIFDHLNDRMFAYGLPHLQHHRDVEIDYHRKGYFSDRVIQDVGTEKIYAIHRKGVDIVLKEVNTFDGSIVRSHVLPTKFHFESAFKIKDGFLYFIAQPDINQPLKWVYRQKIF